MVWVQRAAVVLHGAPLAVRVLRSRTVHGGSEHGLPVVHADGVPGQQPRHQHSRGQHRHVPVDVPSRASTVFEPDDDVCDDSRLQRRELGG